MTPIRVTAVGLDADGVRLIAPGDEAFEPLVDALLEPRWARILRDATPSIVIVSNESPRAVVGLSTVFTVAGGPHTGRNFVFLVAPDAIATTDLVYDRASTRAIPPGAQRMIGYDFVVPCQEDRQRLPPEDRAREEEEFAFYFPQVRNWIESTARELAQASSVHVSIDAVIFDDGLMVGEGRGSLGPHFTALVQARQQAYTATATD